MLITVFANNGSLEIRGEGYSLLADNIKTAKTLAYNLELLDIDLDFDDIFFSSSMDFAEEYGFENNEDAEILWKEGARRWYMTKEAA